MIGDSEFKLIRQLNLCAEYVDNVLQLDNSFRGLHNSTASTQPREIVVSRSATKSLSPSLTPTTSYSVTAPNLTFFPIFYGHEAHSSRRGISVGVQRQL